MWSLLMVVNTLALEEKVDNMATEEMALEGTFVVGTGAPPQVIQLILRKGKFSQSLRIKLGDHYQIYPLLGITPPIMPNRRDLNLTAIT